jgi:hypothetical protein
VACLALASGAHHLTLTELWVTCAKGAAKLAQMFGSFTAAFYVAA